MFDAAGPGDQLTMMLVVGGATLMISLLLLLAFAGGDGNSRESKRRLDEISMGQKPTGKSQARSSARRAQDTSGIKIVDGIVRALIPKPDQLKIRLEKTGFNMTVSKYATVTGMLIVLIIGYSHYLYGLNWFLAVPVGLASGLFIPHVTVGYLGKRRINKFMKTFPEAIELLVRGLRAGLPISEAIVTIGNDAPDPVGKEFRGVADAMRVGQSLEQGLWDVARRIDLPDFKFLIIAISIQRETGGNLAETLGGLANTLRKRRQLKLKIKAMSSEARASAWIIGSLPFIMFFLLWLANESYVMKLVDDPRGMYMIGAGLTMIGSGVGVMAKMVRFEI
ncbi:type II secretion system F family protein [uncultured Sneathiella sp.]|jgi:tight adherence protein B|uniref:type II secretion system F family protein n=1 Tax=uncultured Sneathiella sp. TaxID=879315 RepID=UPI0030D86ED6|tara:strand:- start:24723 stop:25730 length:1008 start_codon:yes stop_codon:yes gene_type:complete